MSRTKHATQVVCLTLLGLCFGWSNVSRAEAPPPQDSLWSQQWNMKNTGQSGGTPGVDIGLLGAWEFTTGSNQVKVAVIGDAANSAHPDFIPVSGNSRIVPDEDPWNFSPEGTSIVGIIAAEANNGGAVKRGIAGIDQGCTVLNYAYEEELWPWSRTNGDNIRDATDAGADVMILSRVFAGPDGAEGPALAYAYKHDVVLVAPIGNDGGQYSYYPASFDGVIGVGSIRDDRQRSSLSNYGPVVDLVAPDGDTTSQEVHWLTSLVPPDGYAKVFKTWYACAHVAGVASLLRGVHPELSNDDIANVLFLSAKDEGAPGRDDEFGYGLVKADSAIRMLQSPNTLRHLPVTSAPSVYSVSGEYACPFYDVEGLAAGVYFVKRYEVRAAVAFPTTYYHFAGAWGRANSTTGLSAGSPNLGIGFAEFVPGTLTPTGGTIRTYVYEIWDLAEEYVGFRPCAPGDVSIKYSALGEELLVSPVLAASVDQSEEAPHRLELSWVDTLSNESSWHIDRKIESGAWEVDYAVLPANSSSFTDTDIQWGSAQYTYRIRPTNVHQTPAFSSEVTVRSRPNPVSCYSAHVEYVNFYSPVLSPEFCEENENECLGGPGGPMGPMGGPMGEEGASQQSSGGGYNCSPTLMVVVDWTPPDALYQIGAIQGYHVVEKLPNGLNYLNLRTGLSDTICFDVPQSFSTSVVVKDVYGRYSKPLIPYTNLFPTGYDWCNFPGGYEVKVAVPGDSISGTQTHEFSMGRNYPNPFNAATILSFSLAYAEDWRIDVVDILGRTVRTIQGFDGPGPVSAPFDGRNTIGGELASGNYFWRLTTPTAVGTKTMTILK